MAVGSRLQAARSGWRPPAPQPPHPRRDPAVRTGLDQCPVRPGFGRDARFAFRFMVMFEAQKEGPEMTTFSKVVFGLAAVLTFLILCSHAQVVSSPTAGRSMVEALKESSRLQYELIHKHYDNALEEMLTVEDIDAINRITGRTALGVACADESEDAIKMVEPLVLTYRADVTLADEIESTPLHYAARAGNLAVVQFLIDNGADVHAENIMGQAPLYSAMERRRVRVAEILKDYGARELDEDATIELHASIALQEAMAAVQRRTERGASGANVQEAFRNRIMSRYCVPPSRGSYANGAGTPAKMTAKRHTTTA